MAQYLGTRCCAVGVAVSSLVWRLRFAFVRLGPERVFFDFTNVQPGVSFADEIRKAIEGCEVMLVLMGPQWLVRGHDGQPAGPGEMVRAEVAAALQLNKIVVPVLVGNARFPRPEEMPPDLLPLVRRQAVQLRSENWEADLERLVDLLGGGTGPAIGAASPAGALPAPSPLPSPSAMRAPAGLWGRLSAVFSGLRLPPGSSIPETPSSSGSTSIQPRPKPTPVPSPPASVANRIPLARALSAGPKVFLSHASEDRPLVTDVLQALESAGLRCWVSFRDIADGEPSWAGTIVGAIANCALMVVVVSKNAVVSRQVLREVTIADSEDIPFLPYCVDATPLSNDLKYFFSAGQRLDAADLEHGEALTRLVAAVRSRASAAQVV